MAASWELQRGPGYFARESRQPNKIQDHHAIASKRPRLFRPGKRDAGTSMGLQWDWLQRGPGYFARESIFIAIDTTQVNLCFKEAQAISPGKESETAKKRPPAGYASKRPRLFRPGKLGDLFFVHCGM